MIIGVDGNEANVEKKVGVSIYTFELLHYFKEHSSKDTQFIIYLKRPPIDDLPQENKYFTYKIISGKVLWSQTYFPLYLYTHKKPDVLFCPAHYAPRFSPIKTVVAIHDLAYFYYPNEFLKKDLFQLKEWTKYSIENATKIISVSKTTKKDIMKFYGIDEKKITVVYNGYRKEKSQKDNKDKAPYSEYLLYVGTLQPRKNIILLMKAFKKVLQNNPKLQLILVGKKGWLSDPIFEKVTELNIKENVHFTGYLPDEELDTLYKHAKAFILPSLYEGFGLPILEAMSRNTAVVTSFTSSLPEIGGDACLYFDPTSVDDIQSKIEIIISDTHLRDELIKKGKDRVQLFSWEKCGEETLNVLKAITPQSMNNN